MNFNLDSKKQQLNNLREYIDSSTSSLDSILQNLQWDKNYIDKVSKQFVICPINPNHRLPQDALAEHVNKCSQNEFGVYLEPCRLETDIHKEQTKLADSALAPNGTKQSRNDVDIKTDKNTLQAELPVVAESKKKSELEILAAERDAKRRTVKYRSGVHTKRKSNTEVLREVIASHMESLFSYPNAGEQSESGESEKLETKVYNSKYKRRSVERNELDNKNDVKCEEESERTFFRSRSNSSRNSSDGFRYSNDRRHNDKHEHRKWRDDSFTHSSRSDRKNGRERSYTKHQDRDRRKYSDCRDRGHSNSKEKYS